MEVNMTEKLEIMFKNPPNEFRSTPFWFLNNEFSHDELRRQIAEMDEKGIGGAVLHPRHGMKVKYMSSEYMDMIGACIDEMNKRGMKVWLYDENNWPSGTYDGELTKNNPDYRMRYIRVESYEVDGSILFMEKICLEEGNSIIDVQAARYEVQDGNILLQSDSIISIASELKNNEINWNVPEGKWLVCIFWECFVAAKVTYKNGYYLDTMNEDAVREFIRLAYQPYIRFNEYFGKTIQGVFTDEPGLMIHDGFFQPSPIRTRIDNLSYNLPGYVLAWTRDFFRKFFDLKGYEFKNYLFALLYDIGEETRKIRLDYYDAIATWYVESYHKAIGDWCRERGLKYIGHTLEEPLWGQVRSQGNQTKVLQQMDYPGYDYLGQGVGTKENPYRILAAKCASSVAHIEGKNRVMCESFGGGGHNHSLFTRKLDANFMAVLGTNMFIPHGFYYSFEGYRKTDWPPTEFYHAPHWYYYKGYADYLGRLSLMAAVGKHKAAACILSPVKTVCMEMFGNGLPNTKPTSDHVFSSISDLMLRYHFDYDYIDDCQLKYAVILDAEMGFPKSSETYPLVILPGVRVISLESAYKLKKFYNSGGKLLFIDCIPECGEKADEDREISAIFNSMVEEGFSNKRTYFLPYDEDFEENLSNVLPYLVQTEIYALNENGSNAEDIICCRRDIDGSTFYMLYNRLMKPQKTHVKIIRKGFIKEWNLEDGTVYSVGECGDWMELDFAEAQLRVLEVVNSTSIQDISGSNASVVDRIKIEGHWNFSTKEPNVLKLDEWVYKTRDRHAMDMEEVNGTPGQVNSYTAFFEVTEIPEGEMRLVLDDIKQWIPSHVGFLARKRSLEIYVNDKKVDTLKPSNWQERQYLEAGINELIIKGTNRLTIHTISLLNPMHALVEPVYILGNFMLMDGKICRNTGKIDGYWSDNGFPYYSGIGIYARTFVLDKDPKSLKELILELDEVRDGCAVKVNGQEVCVKYWPPFSIDILQYVNQGLNNLEIEVFNTLENLYGRNKLKSGLIRAKISSIEDSSAFFVCRTSE